MRSKKWLDMISTWIQFFSEMTWIQLKKEDKVNAFGVILYAQDIINSTNLVQNQISLAVQISQTPFPYCSMLPERTLYIRRMILISHYIGFANEKLQLMLCG